MSYDVHVKVKKLREDAVIPEYAHEGDAGFDLVAVEDVIIEPGQVRVVKTGLAFEVPPGYELQVRPRSGVSLKTDLRVANSPGTVDAPYRGEVGVLLWNSRHNKDDVTTNTVKTLKGPDIIDEEFPMGTYLIRKGDRVAQGVIVPVMRAQFIEVDELSDTERGAGGFGSTGVK
jgi:dUTP pyrophosphatase